MLECVASSYITRLIIIIFFCWEEQISQKTYLKSIKEAEKRMTMTKNQTRWFTFDDEEDDNTLLQAVLVVVVMVRKSTINNSVT